MKIYYRLNKFKMVEFSFNGKEWYLMQENFEI